MEAPPGGEKAKYNLIWLVPNGLYQCMRFLFSSSGPSLASRVPQHDVFAHQRSVELDFCLWWTVST